MFFLVLWGESSGSGRPDLIRRGREVLVVKVGLGVQQDPKAHVEVEDSCHPGCSERERFNVGTRAWSSSETQEAVSHPRLLQGKGKKGKGNQS